MPRISQIRFTAKTSSTASESAYRVDEGMTYREVLEAELGVNPDKFSVLCNGVEVESLDDTVEDGDSIVLQPKKYSSGM